LPILCALVWLAPVASAQPVDADRITLRVAAGQYEIVAVTPLTTVLTPSETATGQSGFWVELQASDGSTLYRRILDDPSRLAFEGPELVRSATRSAPSEIRLMGLRSAQKERKAYAGPLAISRSADIDRGATSTRMQTMSTPSRDEAIAAERVFTVLVPRAQTGDEIVFFGPPASVGTQAEEAGELARIPVSAPAPEVGNE
jgi:hypothetical protein